MYKEIKGDLFQETETGSFDVIAHQVNCFCTQGGGISGEFIFRSDTIIKNTDVPAVRADVRVSKKQDEGNVAHSVKLTTAVIDLPEETIVDMSLFYQDIDEAGKSEYVYFNARVTAYYEVVQ